MNQINLKETIANLLLGHGAHQAPEEVFEGVRADLRAVRPDPRVHSVWEELEHLRLAQEDILRYTFDPGWVSPPWPEGYWPSPEDVPDEARWAKSLEGFLSDRNELVQKVRDEDLDPMERFPHGEGRTYLRQFLLAADHNSYHLGQVVLVRKLLKDWPS